MNNAFFRKLLGTLKTFILKILTLGWFFIFSNVSAIYNTYTCKCQRSLMKKLLFIDLFITLFKNILTNLFNVNLVSTLVLFDLIINLIKDNVLNKFIVLVFFIIKVIFVSLLIYVFHNWVLLIQSNQNRDGKVL